MRDNPMTASYDSEKAELVSVDRAAELCHVEKRTVQRWIAQEKVTAIKKRNGKTMVELGTLPIISLASTVTVDQDQEAMEAMGSQESQSTTTETVTRVNDVGVMGMRQLGLFTDSAHKHIDRLMEKFLTRDDKFQEMMLDELARTREENARLHEELRESRKVEQEVLDGELDRTLAIEDYKRAREKKTQIMTLLVSMGMAKLGDEKTQVLSAALGAILSGEVPMAAMKKAQADAKKSPPPESSQPSDPPDAQASKEKAGA